MQPQVPGYMAEKRRKPVKTEGGYIITTCHGCARWPVRDYWLVPCACGAKICRVCVEEGCLCPNAEEFRATRA